MSIGIMQGRLTPPKGREIQFFPFDNWKQEFYLGKKIGIDEIEIIFDYEDYQNNPLWTELGISELRKVMDETGVIVRSVCFDYFMRRPFFKHLSDESVKNENLQILRKVLQSMDKLDIRLIEIPLVDDSSLKSKKEKELFRDFLAGIISTSKYEGLYGLETDLAPIPFRDFLDSFMNQRVGANYDSGNSSGIGYDPYEEVTTLNRRIFNVHIKDRLFHGTTVKLGTGSADFDRLFKALNEIKYDGSFILQAARDVEGKEKENIISQKDFLMGYIDRYEVLRK